MFIKLTLPCQSQDTVFVLIQMCESFLVPGSPATTLNFNVIIMHFFDTQGAIATAAVAGCKWLDTFEVPTEFSFHTNEAIKTGVLTKSSRVEIIGALATRVLQYTRTPIPLEYQTVCKKLIEKYPTLQDPVGNGYVSKRLSYQVMTYNNMLVFLSL